MMINKTSHMLYACYFVAFPLHFEIITELISVVFWMIHSLHLLSWCVFNQVLAFIQWQHTIGLVCISLVHICQIWFMNVMWQERDDEALMLTWSNPVYYHNSFMSLKHKNSMTMISNIICHIDIIWPVVNCGIALSNW